MITYGTFLYFALFIIVNVIGFKLVKKKLFHYSTIIEFIVILALLLITIACFFPLPIQVDLIEDMRKDGFSQFYNLIPFKTILSITKDSIVYNTPSVFITQILGNALLFVPLGISLYLYLQNRSAVKVGVCVLFTSITVELFQLAITLALQVNYRFSDIDDVILNVAGGMAGYLICSLIYKEVPS